ncbi:MAG: thioredoxin-dependent thiol peroxidase [Nitrospirae bacterium]|nr:thioredoxin-dependent thiol peroxidase [Candidatus Manganitrophaceae bacterium]
MTKPLEPGDEAPPFTLPSSEGKEIDLASYRGKRSVVLYFYPKDDTPGCTKEACFFRDAFSDFKKSKGVILGVSLDPLAAHEKFIKKYTLPFPLLSDADGAVSKAYGVYKLKNMYGRKFWGIERSTFVIDPDGKITHLFRRVKVESHIEEVLAALKASRLVRKT